VKAIKGNRALGYDMRLHKYDTELLLLLRLLSNSI
jgi:hypothetical protein